MNKNKEELLKSAKECLDRAKSSELYAVNGANSASDSWRKMHLDGANELTKTAEAYIKLAKMLKESINE